MSDESDLGECGSQFNGHDCVREHGHAGSHQGCRCDGACDTCDCVEWGDCDLEEGYDPDAPQTGKMYDIVSPEDRPGSHP